MIAVKFPWSMSDLKPGDFSDRTWGGILDAAGSVL